MIFFAFQLDFGLIFICNYSSRICRMHLSRHSSNLPRDCNAHSWGIMIPDSSISANFSTTVDPDAPIRHDSIWRKQISREAFKSFNALWTSPDHSRLDLFSFHSQIYLYLRLILSLRYRYRISHPSGQSIQNSKKTKKKAT